MWHMVQKFDWPLSDFFIGLRCSLMCRSYCTCTVLYCIVFYNQNFHKLCIAWLVNTMYKIEQKVVFETRLQVMIMVLFIRLTMRLGTCCKKPLPAPKGQSKIQAPGKAIHPNKSPGKRGVQQWIDQNILERHQKRTAFELFDWKKKKKSSLSFSP